jgi:hypothetical protein
VAQFWLRPQAALGSLRPFCGLMFFVPFASFVAQIVNHEDPRAAFGRNQVNRSAGYADTNGFRRAVRRPFRDFRGTHTMGAWFPGNKLRNAGMQEGRKAGDAEKFRLYRSSSCFPSFLPSSFDPGSRPTTNVRPRESEYRVRARQDRRRFRLVAPNLTFFAARASRLFQMTYG